MSRVPQRYRILALAHDCRERGDGFTRRDAAWIVGCFELASRIGELEAEGVVFDRKTITARNQYGDPIRYTLYTLVSAPPAARRAAGILVNGPPAQRPQA